MPSAPKKPDGELVDAVTRFEAALRRYEVLVDETEHLKLTSEKQVVRAHRALAECAEEEQRLVAHLTAFVDAMRAAQTRQETAMNARVRAVERLEEKIQTREVLLGRLAGLGEHARSVSTAIAALFAGKGRELSQADITASLGEVEARTKPIVDEAEVLCRDAEAAEWLDIARDADSFKQQIGSARKKVSQLVEQRAQVGGGAPAIANGKSHGSNGGGSNDEGSNDESSS
jgi:hypothetical protein